MTKLLKQIEMDNPFCQDNQYHHIEACCKHLSLVTQFFLVLQNITFQRLHAAHRTHLIEPSAHDSTVGPHGHDHIFGIAIHLVQPRQTSYEDVRSGTWKRHAKGPKLFQLGIEESQ